MSSTRTLLLGVLLDGPKHGYKIRQTLELWGAQYWANVAYGSIYHGLNKMAEEGLLEVLEKGKGGQTVYQITEDGRREFYRMLMEYWWDLKPIIDPFQIALTFMDRLPRPDLLAAMRGRRDELIMALRRSDRAMESKRSYAPRHIEETVRLSAAVLRAQLDWVEDAIERVEKEELP